MSDVYNTVIQMAPDPPPIYDPVGTFIHNAVTFNLTGASLFLAILICIVIWVVTILILRFLLWKWIIRIEGREFHRGWNNADSYDNARPRCDCDCGCRPSRYRRCCNC